jgi:hypothetical protein
MKVVEDFLPDEMFRELSFWLCGGEIAWYFSSNIANEGEENSMNSYFTHTAYLNDEWRSNLGGDILRRLVDEIKDQTVDTEWEIKSLLRIKANLYSRTENLQSHDKHFDFPFSHKAILFYVNDNDGYTDFDTGERIKSQSNRMVFFDGSTLHNSTNCTNDKCRVSLGINYL